MRNPWSAFLLPPPPPPATPGRARGPVWCPVLPPTVTIVTNSPQRNQKTVCIGELVNEMKTSYPIPHLFFIFKMCGRESGWRPYWKVVILEKSWFATLSSQLYLTDLASERLAFGKGMILLQLIHHYLYMFLFSWFEWPYLMFFMLSSLQRNPVAIWKDLFHVMLHCQW